MARKNAKNHPSRNVQAALKACDALDCRMRNMTYEQIAASCGYANAQNAHRAIQRELSRRIEPRVDELRAQEVYLLERMQAAILDRALGEGKPADLWAWDRLLSLSQHRCHLLGLYPKITDAVPLTNVTRTYVLERGPAWVASPGIGSSDSR